MTNNFLQLHNITFLGPQKKSSLGFKQGINVICGASDTGKSFLVESIDFMLGKKELKEILELAKFGGIALDISVSNGENWRFQRATSGGGFKLFDLNEKDEQRFVTLKHMHSHAKTDNVSGFLLNKIGMQGKRILLSSKKGTTNSLSFRNIIQLAIIPEAKIQKDTSPFWSGQYALKVKELAAVKFLLTGVDDSDVVAIDIDESGSSKQFELLDELIVGLENEIAEIGDVGDASEKLSSLENLIARQQESLDFLQGQLKNLLKARRKVFSDIQKQQGRLDEINEHLARFRLLREHYEVDIERLLAIQEGGIIFDDFEIVPCPLCGALPETQHAEEVCDGNVEAIVKAASVETTKIERLKEELIDTVEELRHEALQLNTELGPQKEAYEKLNSEIQKTVAPQVSDMQSTFSSLIKERSYLEKAIDLQNRLKKLRERKKSILHKKKEIPKDQQVAFGIPDAIAHSFSMVVSKILESWNFPGDCHVHFDKKSDDFVIGGKPRGSQGKGLRAITHSAISIGLLKYCQKNELPHPGFVILDSPLLAYFQPRGNPVLPEDLALLKGTYLKERFYDYLLEHHTVDSQIIIIENQLPPQRFNDKIELTIFTKNPNEGRYGLL